MTDDQYTALIERTATAARLETDATRKVLDAIGARDIVDGLTAAYGGGYLSAQYRSSYGEKKVLRGKLYRALKGLGLVA